METNETQTAGLKRHRWRFRLGWITVALVGLLVAVYFVSTSNAFFQRIILPRVGRSIDATVTVSHASIRPFSQVILRDLKVQPRGQDAVLMARELRVRYPLMDLLRGRIRLDDAALDSPTIHVIRNGKLGLTVQRAGKLVAFDLTSQLAGLSAEYQSNRIDGLAVTLATRGQVTEFSQVDLADFNMQATRVGQPLISVKGSGKYNTVSQDADLQTEVEASLVQISSLVIRCVAGDQPRTPADAQLKLDASLLNQRLDLRQAQLSFTLTERALNQLQLTGQVDLSQSHAITGALKLVAESLDLTSYYDLYAGHQAPVAAVPPLADASPSPPDVEPAAIELPLRQFGGTLEIGRFYLRELAVTNLQAAVHIDGSTVKLDPVRLVINGAPTSAKVNLNLGMPGYQYAADLQAQEIPVAPLVNTFQPGRQGQMSGTVSLLAQATGAGLTGPSLQKNLAGQFDLATTNLNLKLIDVRNSLLKSVINVIVGSRTSFETPAVRSAASSRICRARAKPAAAVGWMNCPYRPLRLFSFAARPATAGWTCCARWFRARRSRWKLKARSRSPPS